MKNEVADVKAQLVAQLVVQRTDAPPVQSVEITLTEGSTYSDFRGSGNSIFIDGKAEIVSPIPVWLRTNFSAEGTDSARLGQPAKEDLDDD